MLKRKNGPCRVVDCDKEARYECPRCAVRYCSVACYGLHSERCVREFSEDADEHLRGVKIGEREQKEASGKLRAALERLDEEQPVVQRRVDTDGDEFLAGVADFDSEEDGDSDRDEEHDADGDDDGEDGGRLEGDLGGMHREDIGDVLERLAEEMEDSDMTFDELASRLPKHMVAEFHDMLRDGRIGRFLPLWRPWWIHRRLVSDTIVEDPDVAALPPLPQDGDLSCPIVATSKAAASILFSVADVVYGYCLMMRLHNGDWEADSKAGTSLLWEVCGALADDVRHESMDGALNRFVEKATRATGSEGAALEAVADSSAVFGGRKDWISRALWDVHRMIAAAGSACKGRDARSLKKRRLKVGFLLAWCLGADDAVFGNAAREIGSSMLLQSEAKEQLETARRICKMETLCTNKE